MQFNPLINGVLVIDKPKDWTSFDVVKKVRGMLKVKKVGHAGTLDPMATGVLVLCVGKATKSVSKIMATEKEYIGQITLGATSTTDDAEGDITPNAEAGTKSENEVLQALKKFEGEIDQMPPIFSAKKINGKRAYDLARQGKEVELKPARVTFFEIKLLEYKWPHAKIQVACSKGAYLRSLARDVGQALGVGGYLSMLQRTRVGEFTLEDALSLEEVTQSSVKPI